ncbi:MAG: protease HtpX [Cellvibrionaceae bacterium]
MKRIFLFVATNFAIMLVLGFVMSVVLPLLGIQLNNYGGLLVMSAVFGMGGSFISLAMSKWMALRSVGAEVIKQPRNQTEQWLFQTVERQAKAAGIAMPEVAIYNAPDVNAFATGMSRNSSLVAVSTGLLQAMTADEAEAVLGHEVSHVANGDMVTLSLLQGVMNTFVYFLSSVIASMINRGSNNRMTYYLTSMALQAVFGALASIIVMWFSRYREYRADAGGAQLAGKEKMIAALQRLQQQSGEAQLDGKLVAFGISNRSSLSELFTTHPPLAKRIEALKNS